MSVRQYNECGGRSLHSLCFRVKIIIAIAAGKYPDERWLTQKNRCSVLYIWRVPFCNMLLISLRQYSFSPAQLSKIYDGLRNAT